MPKNQPRINEAKRSEVEKLKELLRKYSVIGIADLTSLPSRQLQAIRAKLKKELTIRNFKKRFVKIAISEIKAEKDLSSLKPFLKDSNPAILFSNNDPFKLSKEPIFWVLILPSSASNFLNSILSCFGCIYCHNF